ncbi:hypothetical protein QE152_g14361 [Popillia japonica]|uniref:t-SNARE coiled-coil homology domain-containing protein n=1 Tax=Popillia japonica TaxID=7064 RepID=A0AAW1LA94_POPJA
MEAELQNQLDSFDKDRKHMSEKSELMADQIKDFVEQQETLAMEITDYKSKLDEQHKMLSANIEAYDKLENDYRQNLLALNQLQDVIHTNEETITKLNQQILENEKVNAEKIEKLSKEIQQKSVKLEDSSEQNLQIHFQGALNQANQLDFASSFFDDHELQHLKQTNQNLEKQIVSLQKEKENLHLLLSETQKHLEEIKLQTNLNKEEPLRSEELKSLKAQYNTLEVNYDKLTEENCSLQNNIAKLSEQLYKLNSSRQFENSKPSTDSATFTWPSEDVVEKKIINTSETSSHKIDNTKEELLDKIRSLEFMFHDSEKQKENAVIQCNALSEELTKILYRQEQQQTHVQNTKPQLETASLDLLSQIVSSDDTTLTEQDLKELRDIEFMPSKDITDHQSPSPTPVVEDIIKPKKAYLCYDPEEIGESSKSFDYAFGENDDGWGWGPEEAKLEQEHYDQVSVSPQSAQFKNQINQLEEKIKVLEQARERHSEEIQQSQLKSSKLIKKLKEFKSKNEELCAKLNKKSIVLDDLDDAIQDELKSQIKNLEKKIREINTDLDKEKQEKTNLLKRIDTLTASHERMIENKEKQDIEIMSWQQRYREVTAKLEQLEWGDDSPKHIPKAETEKLPKDLDDSKKIQELSDTIRDLTLDNEELQSLLEEQRNLRIAAEKAKSIEPMMENMKTEKEYLDILEQKDNLQTHFNSLNEELEKLKQDHANLMNINEDTNQKLNSLSVENNKLQEQVKNTDTIEIEDLKKHIDQLNIEKQGLLDDQAWNTDAIWELRQNLEQMQNRSNIFDAEKMKYEDNILQLNNSLKLLNDRIESLKSENNDLETKIKELEESKQHLLLEMQQKDTQCNSLNETLTDLNVKLKNMEEQFVTIQSQNTTDLNVKLKNMEEQFVTIQSQNTSVAQIKDLLLSKEDELANFKEKLQQQEKDYEFKLATTVQQLSDEWLQRVDQRGLDIAESWKLHLETRENEFVQIEQQLKKEIVDLEEKHTALVNENNELRKNVDAEIRNEIDRVAALQQQINERQHYINDLTKVIQEQQAEIEKQKIEQKIEVNNFNTIIEDLNRQIVSRDTEIQKYEALIRDNQEELKQFNEKEKLAKLEQSKEVENFKQALSIKDSEIIDRDNKISEFSKQVEELKIVIENLSSEINQKSEIIDATSKQLNNVNAQHDSYQDQINQLNQHITEYQQQLANFQLQTQQQYMQIEALNQQILNYSGIHEESTQKEAEIIKLSALIQEKDREHSIILDSKVQENQSIIREHLTEIEHLNQRLADSENRYEELLSIKDSDMQNLRIELDEQIRKNESYLLERQDYLHIQTELGVKTGECEELKSKLEEQNLLMVEESKQLSELREIIQEQVLKIDDLQKELYEKSRLYDAIIAEIDITHKPARTEKADKHVSFSDDVEVQNMSSSSNEEDLTEPVSRAELDLALYMLHQRDVRCEELTVELMQLLEERDTLQLKLSNALREKEILISKYDASSEPTPSSATSMIQTASSSDVSQEPESLRDVPRSTGSDPLVSKLSELRTIGYRKDKTLVDEQELRRLQQLSIMQQHRDEAAKLPPEAAARLVDASYTLSRDVQSPSKVLLNWLWGRSTPKVNNV